MTAIRSAKGKVSEGDGSRAGKELYDGSTLPFSPVSAVSPLTLGPAPLSPVSSFFQKTASAAPLVVLRVLAGLMIFASLLRFWGKGWIDELYIKPRYFFAFYGFEWVKPLGGYTYVLFMICMVSALLVMLGWFYRVAIVSLFLSFTYIELMDKSTYLNHYYFISLLCFVLIFLPAHVNFSVDAYRRENLRAGQIPAWCIGVVKLLVFILYFYAGLAKLNSDWLLHALPLRIWLPARNDMPVIGTLFNYEWVAYAFSWFGCFYDLFIVFFLINPKTRVAAYVTVIAFHLMTALLFPIGMFPYIMIVAALVFFSPAFHEKLIHRLGAWLRLPRESFLSARTYVFSTQRKTLLAGLFTVFFVFQFIFPFRYLFYPGELFWSEQGYRFSWRVMLMEKAGQAQFLVKDRNGRQAFVDNAMFLTTLQEKMMATQPDMILQYAHMLQDFYARQGFVSPQVFVDSYVALNGRLGRPLIDPEVDLARQTDSFQNKSWILPLHDEIKGF
jgi:hypothetical protein